MSSSSVYDSVEELRIIVTLGLLATIIGGIALLPSDGLWPAIKTLSAISGVFGFLYVVWTAALLKYSRNNEIGQIAISNNRRKSFYNLSIDIYGYLVATLLAYGSAYIFGWRNGVGLNSVQILFGILTAGLIVANTSKRDKIK